MARRVDSAAGMLRTSLLFASALAACTSSAPPGTSPSMVALNHWIAGKVETVQIEWDADDDCDTSNIAQCDPAPTEVLRVESVSCDGCTITDDPSGSTSGGIQTIQAIGTTAGTAATIHARVTYVPSGTTVNLDTTVLIDTEVSLGARCATIDSALLANFVHDLESIPGPDPEEPGLILVNPCGPTRRSTDTVVVFPEITTLLGDTIFPFLPDGARDLSEDPDPDERALSTLALSQAPDGWWDADDQLTTSFAYFAHPADSITLHTRLSSGELATATVAIPRVCDGPCPPLYVGQRQR